MIKSTEHAPARQSYPRLLHQAKLSDVPGLAVACDIEPLLRQRDLTRVLNCSLRVIERMRAAGRLPKPDLYIGNRSPRWRPESIRRWIADQAERGGAR
jgi:predicted DNA-binding transcriptional regulator AlpA